MRIADWSLPAAQTAVHTPPDKRVLRRTAAGPPAAMLQEKARPVWLCQLQPRKPASAQALSHEQRAQTSLHKDVIRGAPHMAATVTMPACVHAAVFSTGFAINSATWQGIQASMGQQLPLTFASDCHPVLHHIVQDARQPTCARVWLMAACYKRLAIQLIRRVVPAIADQRDCTATACSRACA